MKCPTDPVRDWLDAQPPLPPAPSSVTPDRTWRRYCLIFTVNALAVYALAAYFLVAHR